MKEVEDHFLEDIRTELALVSPEEAKPLVRSVLQALRQTLSRQSAEALLTRFPEFMKKYFTIAGKDEKEVRVEHLDEFVTFVMEQDRKNSKSLFKSELQSLSVILLTLKRVFTTQDQSSVTGISHPFYQELRDAAMEG